VLREAAARLEPRIPAAARVLCEEQGKTVREAESEFGRALETLRWNADHAESLCASQLLSEGRRVMPQAIGTVAAFAPWNYPAVLAARKLATALVVGCPVILKAAEEAPGAAEVLLRCLSEAGLPAGAASLLFGDPAAISAQLLDSDVVKAISFTGSTRVGRQLAEQAARRLQRCVLELGGHAPVLVFADADLKAAARAISDYKFECAGQSCNAPSRVYVQAPVYEAFLAELNAVVSALRVGPGTDPEVDMGPMASQRQVDRVARLVADAVDRGAVLCSSARQPDGMGFYMAPVVLRDVPAQAALLAEEPFGPVLPVMPFDTPEQAVELANATRYGLAAYVFTSSARMREEVVHGLRAGVVGVNLLKGAAPDAPLNGVDDSGYGCEGGLEGARSFQFLKLING
jgi:succinate-semialdehyde dehydrogenase/glutarate-semialdehyde dehydrogenase